MKNYLKGKSIIITGAASGFGQLVAQKTAEMGANVTAADINADGLAETVASVKDKDGKVQSVIADVTKFGDMQTVAAKAIEAYGAVDIILNNAGTMPLAFYADHEAAIEQWHKCVDINFKGVVNGIACVYDHMMGREEGHVINLSSIFGNFPVAGSNVYGATKVAVTFLSESLRVEAAGKIKVTVIKPTGVMNTGLFHSMVNPAAAVGIVGHNGANQQAIMDKLMSGTAEPDHLNPDSSKYVALDAGYVADQIVYAMNQPKGVSVSDITVRATGDQYIL